MAKEYIEREAANKAIELLRQELEIDDADAAYNDALIDCRYDIAHIPAADVVEVVRCKDCRYAYDSVGGWCCSRGVCVDCIVREDFFCADGERKDGDGE